VARVEENDMTKNTAVEIVDEAPAPQIVNQDQALLSVIERVAMDPNADIDKLERMLAMKERLDAKNAEAEFATAFARASASFPNIPLRGEGHNKKPYALLKDIMEYTRPALSENGIALSFSIDVSQEVVVSAILAHRSGHTRTTSIALPRDSSGSKNAVQAIGSSQTYGQRYTAQAILGLSLGEDTEDDGQSVGAAETVDAEQYIKLRDALESSGMDPVKFHTAFGHKTPDSADLQFFPAARFQEAIDRLAKYQAAKS